MKRKRARPGKKKIVVIAGPNGAGKTTFAQDSSRKNHAESNCVYVRVGRSFAFETTLSGMSYARHISRWREDGRADVVMSYFADLTPHIYAREDTEGQTVLNVGWLDPSKEYPRGEVSVEFVKALEVLCERPVYLHRGFHDCRFCPRKADHHFAARIGNGQIRVMDADGIWYAAPTMIHHYVTVHHYQPPSLFICAVLKPTAVACRILKPRPAGGYPAKTNPPK